jgi:hypothetical protein
VSAHEEWVTGQVKDWLEKNGQAAVDFKLAEIRRENEKARADGYDNEDGSPEDTEYLADALEEFTSARLTADLTGIRLAFVRDCVSECDWLEIAAGYLET